MLKDQLYRVFIRLFMFSLLLGVFGCNSSEDTPVPINPVDDSEVADELHTIEQDVHQQINQFRQTQNLPVLQWNETIVDYCRSHSLDMAAGTVEFGHHGFDDRVAGIGQSLSYEAASENVAYNNFSDPATTAVQGWIDSSGHLANIKGNFHLTGVGVAQSDDGVYYFTQMFFRQ